MDDVDPPVLEEYKPVCQDDNEVRDHRRGCSLLR